MASSYKIPYFFVFSSVVAQLLLLISTSSASPPLQLEPQVGLDVKDYSFHNLQEKEADTQQPKFRLPITVIPIHYNLDIQPFLEFEGFYEHNFTAPGHVSILVQCVENTQTIVLHSHSETTHNNVTVRRVSDGANIVVNDFTFDGSVQSFTITLGSNLVQSEEYIIEIDFISRVNDGQNGLYRSYYSDENGNRRYIATTQFESIGARRCFPCFDEPALRATFDIRLGRNLASGYHTLCNTEIIGEPEPIEGWSGWVWDRYNTTPNMPTYLIAIIVSDFGFEPSSVPFRVPVKTWGPVNQIAGGTGVFSANVQAKLLTFFEEYFQSPYQISKMDSVAVEIFAAGAMENWGLNTYRVPLMLFVEGEMTQFEKWRQAAVISHEISHQWFGNLFTMTWWNDLWLKEGFARYWQFLGVEGSEPNLEAMNRVVLDCIQIAMENDIGPNSHALHRPITDVMPSSNARIIYEKGASLIRMMQAILTEETLISGLRKFLVRFSYSSAIQSDLFDILTEQAHQDGTLPSDTTLFDIMESWTERIRFPILRVTRVGPTSINIHQQEFFANNNPTSKDLNPGDLWEVPISYASQALPDFSSSNWQPKFWLHKNESNATFEVENTSQWILLNPDARNYYRVLYDDSLHQLVKNLLDSSNGIVSLSSKSQLLDDYFVAAYNNYSGIREALELTTYLHQETEYVVWTTFFNKIRRPYTLLSDTDVYQEFKDYVVSKLQPQLEAVGLIPVEGEEPVPAMHRAQLLDWACSMNPILCSEAALELLATWIGNPDRNPVTADIQAVIYCAAISSTNDEVTKEVIQRFILQRYNNVTTSVRQRGLLLNALACHTDEVNLQRTLNMALNATSGINRDSDGVTLIQRVAENSNGRDLAFQFLRENRDEIIEIFDATAISRVVSTLSNYFSTNERITEVEEFIEANIDLPDDVLNSLNTSLGTVRTNTAWLNNHLQGIRDFLRSL